jgi:hypothetical protein
MATSSTSAKTERYGPLLLSPDLSVGNLSMCIIPNERVVTGLIYA